MHNEINSLECRISQKVESMAGAPYQVRPARPRSYLDFPEKRGKGKAGVPSNYQIHVVHILPINLLNQRCRQHFEFGGAASCVKGVICSP